MGPHLYLCRVIIDIFWQEFVSCTPESETCVANQTLKDKNCLVACDGVYADIALSRDAMNQNTKEGTKTLHLLPFSKFYQVFRQ